MLNHKRQIVLLEFVILAVLVFWPLGCRSVQPQSPLTSQGPEWTSGGGSPDSMRKISEMRQYRRAAVQNDMARQLGQARNLYQSFGQEY